MTSFNSQDSRKEIRDLWLNSDMDAKYLAYKYGMSEQTIRNMVRGLKAPIKERRTLSRLHRAVGLLVVDKRLKSNYTKQAFANAHGMTHVKLSDIEKGQHDITITEIINLGILDSITGLDTTLLGID